VSGSPSGQWFDDVVAVPAVGETGWGRTMLLAPGATRLRFATESAPLDVPDARTLAFRFSDAHITVRG
jgi:hypothetical protein